MLFLLCLLLIGTFIFFWIRYVQNYWANRGVPYLSIPLSSLFAKPTEHAAYAVERIYKKFKSAGDQYVGIPSFSQPSIMLLDLELIKKILVTEFDSFPDRGQYQNPHDDPLSSSILRARGEVWKKLRVKLTPTFTSAKMRYMFGTLVQVAENFTKIIEEKVKSGGGGAVLDMRDFCTRFTTDVIGLVAFGINCDSLRYPEAEFRVMGEKAFHCWSPLLEYFGNSFPLLARLLHLKTHPSELINFYTDIVTKNIEYRERQNIRRKDFLDVMIELKNQKQVAEEFKMTTEEIIGQSFAFFIAGSDTSSATMSNCIFELSQNQDIQQRAREEVLQCLEKHGNEMTYECMQDLKYLDQCIMETLRKYPPVPVTRRVARKEYRLPNTNVVIEKGSHVFIPVFSIHHDPEYYSNPEVFDPERYTLAAVQARHPMTTLAFGAGPRVCIAERYGRMQTKIGLATILRQFLVTPASMTPSKLEFDIAESRFLRVKDGILVKLEKI